MINKIHIKLFKSIEDVEFEPGLVNVLIGANGSGKSNLLEAIGVLSAAASGRVDDESLLRRGVRPGVPALYKCAFPGIRDASNIFLSASSDSASYQVSLSNPIKDPQPAWRYCTERLMEGKKKLVERSRKNGSEYVPDAGLVASKIVEMKQHSHALALVEHLKNFAIFTPNTPTLRGFTPDTQQRHPVGLSGGQLANALSVFFRSFKEIKKDSMTMMADIFRDSALLIDWAKSFESAEAADMPLSQSVGSMKRVIRFVDRFMKTGRNSLSGYDVSEGALYVIFHAVLAAHSRSPLICAVENADHSLNPRLARELFKNICKWYLDIEDHQIFLTTHNPLVLDGLPLLNDKIRLFTVSRTVKGRTVVNRIEVDENMKKMADDGWTLSRLWVMGNLGGIANV